MHAPGKQKTGREEARHIAELASEKKGQDIVLLDLRKVSTVCDWFVLVSANSDRQVNSISRSIQKMLSKEGVKPLHIEGRNNPHWTLLDYNDVVVHVFHKDIREFYGLERLWSDAPREQFDGKCLKETFQKKSQKPS